MVLASCDDTSTPRSPSPTAGVAVSAGSFPVAVWMQDPTRQRGGEDNAKNYADIGANTFLAMWKWPNEYWPGYGQQVVDVLAANGHSLYATGDAASITKGVSYRGASAILKAHFLDDEADMNKVNKGACCSSTTFNNHVVAANKFDPARPTAANFGKGFSLYPWPGYHCDDGSVGCGAYSAELTKYCSNLAIASADYYAATDAYEPENLHTPNYYGKVIDHLRQFCPTTTKLYGFVETGHPGNQNGGVTYAPFSSGGTITPVGIETAVWSILAHGADGIVYFVHDFNASGIVAEDGIFDHPDNLKKVTQLNAFIAANSVELSAPRQANGLSLSAGVDATLRADAEGRYVVAAESSGQAHAATFTVRANAGKLITVAGENRTIQADANGTWTDNLRPWSGHLYVAD
jgi:hypothetical protein